MHIAYKKPKDKVDEIYRIENKFVKCYPSMWSDVEIFLKDAFYRRTLNAFEETSYHNGKEEVKLRFRYNSKNKIITISIDYPIRTWGHKMVLDLPVYQYRMVLSLSKVSYWYTLSVVMEKLVFCTKPLIALGVKIDLDKLIKNHLKEKTCN